MNLVAVGQFFCQGSANFSSNSKEKMNNSNGDTDKKHWNDWSQALNLNILVNTNRLKIDDNFWVCLQEAEAIGGHRSQMSYCQKSWSVEEKAMETKRQGRLSQVMKVLWSWQVIWNCQVEHSTLSLIADLLHNHLRIAAIPKIKKKKKKKIFSFILQKKNIIEFIHGTNPISWQTNK